MNSVNNEEKFKKMSSKRLPKHHIICVYANSIIKPSEDGNYLYNIYIIGNYLYTLMCSQQTWVNN